MELNWKALGLVVLAGCGGTPDSPHHLVRTNTASTSNFTAVTGSGAGDVWAVGLRTDPVSSTSDPVVAHFDGHAWTEQRLAGATDVAEVLAISPSNVWVSGLAPSGTAVFHWDGAAWTTFALQGCSGQSFLARASDAEVWVACENAQRSSVFRFDGAAFVDVTPSNLSTGFAATLFGNGSGNMFMGDLSVLGHWDGAAWSAVHNPAPDENGILGFLGVPNMPRHVNATPDGPFWFMAAGLNQWDGKADAATRVTDTSHAYGPLAVVSKTEAYWAESIDGSKEFKTTDVDVHCHHLHHCFETESTTTHKFPDFVVNVWDGKSQAYLRAADHDHESQIISLWAASLTSLFAVDDNGQLWTVQP